MEFVFYVLTALIFLSKEILVFNEEILVLFSFLVFSFLFYYFIGSIFIVELDLRFNKIKNEFCFYQELHKKTLNYIISYYNKQKLLCEKLKLILLIVNKSIDFALCNSETLHLKLMMFNVNDKLKRLIINQSKIISLLQEKINLKLFVFLFIFYNKNKNKYKYKRIKRRSKRKTKQSSQLLSNSIRLLSLLANK
jgi:hypothetical protein